MSDIVGGQDENSHPAKSRGQATPSCECLFVNKLTGWDTRPVTLPRVSDHCGGVAGRGINS